MIFTGDRIMATGFFIIFIGIMLVIVGSLLTLVSGKSHVKGGAIGFIGPFPLFGFASDRKIFYILFGIGIIVFILSLILRRYI